jgi:hypothetical protein
MYQQSSYSAAANWIGGRSQFLFLRSEVEGQK